MADSSSEELSQARAGLVLREQQLQEASKEMERLRQLAQVCVCCVCLYVGRVEH